MKKYKVVATVNVNATLFVEAETEENAKRQAVDEFDIFGDLRENFDREMEVSTEDDLIKISLTKQ